MEKHENHDTRLEQYIKLLNDLPEKFSRESTFPEALISIVGDLSNICLGEVFYSIHTIYNDMIRFIAGGPEMYLERRKSTDEVPITKGLIGKTLSKNSLFNIYNRVDEQEGYRKANDHTKAELVIKIPNITSKDIIGVINIESSEQDAFDHLDGIIFSIVAAWEASRFINERWLVSREGLLDNIINLLHQIRDAPGSFDNIYDTFAKIVKSVLPYDAISILSLSYMNIGDDSNLNKKENIETDYLEGHEKEKDNTNFNKKISSLLLNIFDSGSPLTENINEFCDKYRIQERRQETKYAIGARHPHKYQLSPPNGAILLEFNDVRESEKNDSQTTQQIADLCEETKGLSTLAKEWRDLHNVVEMIPLMVKDISIDTDTRDLLRSVTEQLKNNIRADACIFYEISPKNENNQQELTLLADSIKPGFESNVFWTHKVKKNWAQISTTLKHSKYHDAAIIISPSSKGTPKNYRIFATKVHASLYKEILFISLKASGEKKVRIFSMSKVSHKIIDVQLRIAALILERNKLNITNNAHLQGMRYALQMWFKQIVESSESKSQEELKELIFQEAHRLLENWEGVIGPPFTAIFEYNEEEQRLVMTASTYNYLKKKAKDKGILSSFPLSPLHFDINPNSSMASKGLTHKVWVGDDSSQVSFKVSSEGDVDCRKWWDGAVGARSKNRYFAGSKITHPNKRDRYGVLTINGIKPQRFLHRPLEVEWEVLPLLEILASELARQLASIEDRP
jgi:hypothetical protein